MNNAKQIPSLIKVWQSQIESLNYQIADLTQTRNCLRYYISQMLLEYSNGRYEDRRGNLWLVKKDGVLNHIPVSERLKQNPKWEKKKN